MEPALLITIARYCGGQLLAGSPELMIRGMTTDSRLVNAGDVFVALRGDRFDGHDFVNEAAARGASAVLVEHSGAGSVHAPCAVIAVENTRRALGLWGAAYRLQFNIPILVVAGSNGKTTTKELLAAILAQARRVLASPASFNNDIGVPLTLLRLEHSHAAAVLEVGTNHPGELAPLVRMVQPRFGLLTGLGREHLEFFGDLDGVAREEGWLAELLPPSGALFVPGDDPLIPQVTRRAAASVVTVGRSDACDWRGEELRVDKLGTTFMVRAPLAEWSGEYRMRLLGRHQVLNALLALAAAAAQGIRPAEARRALTAFNGPKMRLQLGTIAGVHVLDDSYNANADSMRAALETFRDLGGPGRRVAVLGEMAELGAHTHAAHEEVGRRAATTGVQHLFAVGKSAAVVGGAARAGGVADVREFADVTAAAAAVRRFVQPGDWLLVKASRSTGLDRVIECLKASVDDMPQSRPNTG